MAQRSRIASSLGHSIIKLSHDVLFPYAVLGYVLGNVLCHCEAIHIDARWHPSILPKDLHPVDRFSETHVKPLNNLSFH